MADSSSSNPSARYQSLIESYKSAHQNGLPADGLTPEQVFSGGSLRVHVARIKSLLKLLDAKSLLDYGCGKGLLHKQRPFRSPDGVDVDSLQEYWGLQTVVLYDPAVAHHDRLPADLKCDAVICTDVLEHCPEDDIDWILVELFTRARKLVFANIASYPARKTLPNGENAHCTIKSASWWAEKITKAAGGADAFYFILVQERSLGFRGIWRRLFPKTNKPHMLTNLPTFDR